jgi:hypothetical protein
MVGLELIHFRPQELAALTIFRDRNPDFPPVAGRPKDPSAVFDGRNRLVLRQFPLRPVGVDPADMMNSVVRACSVGSVHAPNSNLMHAPTAFFVRSTPP